MSHIKTKYGIWAAVITHYGITIAGSTLFAYIKCFTDVKIVWSHFYILYSIYSLINLSSLNLFLIEKKLYNKYLDK